MEEEGNVVKVVVQGSRNNPAGGLIVHLSSSLFPLELHEKVFDLIIHLNGSGRILSAPPAATKAQADTQSTAADHLRPETNSQAPQSFRSDPSRAPKWLKLPGMF